MKAITTRFHGPTNTRGARISASDLDGNRVMLSFDYALNEDQRHRAAAVALCQKMQWPGAESLVGGSVKHGMVWVFTHDQGGRS